MGHAADTMALSQWICEEWEVLVCASRTVSMATMNPALWCSMITPC